MPQEADLWRLYHPLPSLASGFQSDLTNEKHIQDIRSPKGLAVAYFSSLVALPRILTSYTPPPPALSGQSAVKAIANRKISTIFSPK